ncbi:dead-box atp-dependent RNA helicase 37-like isoform x1 [Anaeramoeba flamelloides]|uniref:RNA helicase n=1 Tax=Anaeramoeba flamelloides TaxID=1746091 RepID=A0ABQ8XSA3_9EUKA|nr:dead-box atp-dependent RNA helicase 37-like isoform x1 [Anaeramoeba flamelloides]
MVNNELNLKVSSHETLCYKFSKETKILYHKTKTISVVITPQKQAKFRFKNEKMCQSFVHKLKKQLKQFEQPKKKDSSKKQNPEQEKLLIEQFDFFSMEQLQRRRNTKPSRTIRFSRSKQRQLKTKNGKKLEHFGENDHYLKNDNRDQEEEQRSKNKYDSKSKKKNQYQSESEDSLSPNDLSQSQKEGEEENLHNSQAKMKKGRKDTKEQYKRKEKGKNRKRETLGNKESKGRKVKSKYDHKENYFQGGKNDYYHSEERRKHRPRDREFKKRDRQEHQKRERRDHHNRESLLKYTRFTKEKDNYNYSHNKDKYNQSISSDNWRKKTHNKDQESIKYNDQKKEKEIFYKKQRSREKFRERSNEREKENNYYSNDERYRKKNYHRRNPFSKPKNNIYRSNDYRTRNYEKNIFKPKEEIFKQRHLDLDLLRKKEKQRVQDEEEGKIASLFVDLDAYDEVSIEINGDEIPEPMEHFYDLDIGEIVYQNVKKARFGRPTPVQKHSFSVIMNGRDLMACAETGSGKTVAFACPIISEILFGGIAVQKESHYNNYQRRYGFVAKPLCLILTPIRELSQQIYKECIKFSNNSPLNCFCVYGGTPIYNQIYLMKKQPVHLLVATPGRLIDLLERREVDLRKLKFLVLDEADRMLDMGFIPQIREIIENFNMPIKNRQTLMFSATFPKEIQRLASDFLRDYIFLSVGKIGSATSLVTQKIRFVEEHEKFETLIDLLTKHTGLTLIFVERKIDADNLDKKLYDEGFHVLSIHGNKTQKQREESLKLFKNTTVDILVATDVAARGLDVPNVTHVINYDLPKDITDYIHRIGRTGRAGQQGLATAFINHGSNKRVIKKLIGTLGDSEQEIPEWLFGMTENNYDRRIGGGRFGNRRRNNNPNEEHRFNGIDYRNLHNNQRRFFNGRSRSRNNNIQNRRNSKW